MRKLLLLCGCLLGAALVLSACGGGDSDEDKIVSAVETSATSTDPADCLELQTQAFMEQSSDEEGEAAVKECEEDATNEEENADSVEVTEVEVDGANGTANAAFVGGGFDGQTLTVALVNEDDQWKLDEVTGFAELDKTKLIETFEEKLGEAEEVGAGTISCIVESLEEASQAEFEELLLSGSSEPFVELAESCS